MKVVVYQGQSKITVDNVSIPNRSQLDELIKHQKEHDMTLNDLQLYGFQITSTRGALYEESVIEDEDIEKEIEEGINWRTETVN